MQYFQHTVEEIIMKPQRRGRCPARVQNHRRLALQRPLEVAWRPCVEQIDEVVREEDAEEGDSLWRLPEEEEIRLRRL